MSEPVPPPFFSPHPLNDGGPAFPVDGQRAHTIAIAACQHLDRQGNQAAYEQAYMQAMATALSGQSLRDHFASQALIGLLAGNSSGGGYASLAGACYQLADEMLKARAR